MTVGDGSIWALLIIYLQKKNTNAFLAINQMYFEAIVFVVLIFSFFCKKLNDINCFFFFLLQNLSLKTSVMFISLIK